MSYFCSSCGKPLNDGEKFCPNCGCSVKSEALHNVFSNKSVQTQNLALQLSNKEKTAAIIWLVVAIIQMIIGLLYNWPTALVGIWNAFASATRFKKSKNVLHPWSGMVDGYRKNLVGIIIFLVINILIGGVLGVIGSVYDLLIRNFMLENATCFEHDTLEAYNQTN